MFPIRFQPKLLPSLICIALFILLIKLGMWQLDRAQQKQVLIAQHAANTTQQPFVLTAATTEELSPFQLVTLTGHYINNRQFLLDNRFYQHQVGYETITPFDLGDAIVLINRGWLPRRPSRDDLPNVDIANSTQTIYGMIQPLPSKPFVLKQQQLTDDWPQVIQAIQLDGMAQQFVKPLLPFVIRLGTDQPYGFVRDWPIVTMSPQRHRAYAVQWFALAGTLVVLYLIISCRKQSNHVS